MSLSLEKLYHFAEVNGYTILKIYTKDSKCHFIEMLSLNKIDFILLYIPEKYNFIIPSELTTYPLQTVYFDENMNENMNDDIGEYTHISESIMEQSYGNVENILIPTKTNIPLSQHLNESYKRNIILKDIEGKDNIIIKDIYRQLRRLKYSIQGMSHKLAIMNAPYLGVLTEDDLIKIYSIENLKRKNAYKMYIIINFTVFYDKIKILEEECNQIFEGIYKVLNNNHKLHSKNIKHIMEKKENIQTQSLFLQNVKYDYTKYIKLYCDLLDELYTNQKNKQHDLDQLNSQQIQNVHHDMKRTHQKQKIKKDIRSMEDTKKHIIKTTKEAKTKYQNLILSIDTILFDNIIMLDKIFRNFKQLDELEELLK